MNHEELKVVAKELSINDADSLSYNQLKSKVSQVKKANETIETVEVSVDSTSQAVTAEVGENILEAASISIGEVPDNSEDGNPEVVICQREFKDESGRTYGFSDSAPAKFRYNNVVKTQEEWLQDQDAMEQLALGNCSFVEQIFE